MSEAKLDHVFLFPQEKKVHLFSRTNIRNQAYELMKLLRIGHFQNFQYFIVLIPGNKHEQIIFLVSDIILNFRFCFLFGKNCVKRGFVRSIIFCQNAIC